jgi:putative oxidoreductase
MIRGIRRKPPLADFRPRSCRTGEVQGIMNLRNRYLVVAIRILLGLIMLASGISGLLMGNSAKGVPPQMVTFTQVFWASGIFQMVKVTEIVAGFMLLFGIFPALATLFLAPDVVGIVIVNARLMPSFLWIGAVVFVLTAYLGYAYWDKYKLIFSRN